MMGKGDGPVYDTNLQQLQDLPRKVLYVRRIKLYAVNDRANALNLNSTVPILDVLDYVDRMDIFDWYSTVNDIRCLGYRFETCPHIHIVRYLLEELDVSSATVDQEVHVIDAPAMRSMLISSHTTVLSITNAQLLGQIIVCSGVRPKLSSLNLVHCDMKLARVKVFQNIRSLSIEHCRFDGINGLKPIQALRASLVHLWFWRNLDDGDDEDDEPLVLILNNFLKLETVSVGECHFLDRLVLFNSRAITDVEIISCALFVTLRCHDRPGSSVVSGMPDLVTLKVINCPRVTAFTMHDLPKLQEIDLSNNSIHDLHVDGTSCGALSSLELGRNELWDDSCHLVGSFPKLVSLGLSTNMLCTLPSLWQTSMPALQTLVMCSNYFEEPLDVSSFRNLIRIDLRSNHCAAVDRGGLPFILRVRAHLSGPARRVELVGIRARLVDVGDRIPDVRLAPFEDQTESESDDDHPMW